jgi:hypothetical protein
VSNFTTSIAKARLLHDEVDRRSKSAWK